METLNLFDLFARIVLDTSDYDAGLDDASRNTESFADKLKNGLTAAAKVGAAALGAAATGVAALTKSSLEQYAEYEQLVGGVDTLFKDASDTIQQYASNAYKTAGVSANTYMEQATAFSASLIQSLGGDTQAAAEYANQAIMDMSDNANKMGTDIESIQQTYQSLMRGNYAMLDNLKLGYGGTKSELERLVADAEKLTGQALDPAKFSDVITAIHAVQENLGITGTTAKEAATTIQGSIGMMQAAWSNLIAGIGDKNSDLDTLIENFVSSVGTAADNVLPRITQILIGFGTAIQQLAPIISSQMPAIITSVVPSLVSAGSQLLVGIITGIVSAAPQLVAAVPGIITSLVDAFSANGPALLSAGQQLLTMFSTGIVDGFPIILENGTSLLNNLIEGITGAIPDLIAALPGVISSITGFIADNLPLIVSAGISILLNLISGIVRSIPDLVATLPQIIDAIVNGIGAFMDSVVQIGKNIVEGIWEGITGAGQWLKDKVSGFFDDVVGGVKDFLGIHSPSRVFMSIGEYMMQGLAIGMENSAGEVMETVQDLIDEVTDRFNTLADAFTAKQDISDLEYQLWERTLGQGATEAEKYDMQLQMLQNQQSNQVGVVEAAAAAYQAVVEQYGENSAESLSYQKTLLEESLAYQDLVDQINEVIAAKQQLYNTNTATVSYADSTSGRATEAAINAVSGNTGNQDITLNANLVMPDGSKFASWQLPFLINAGRAAGTPIANPQVG